MIDLIDWIMKLDHNYDVLHYFPLIGTSSAPSMARDCDQEMTLECKKKCNKQRRRRKDKVPGKERFLLNTYFIKDKLEVEESQYLCHCFSSSLR